MPSGVVKTKRDEEKWERAKEVAAEAGEADNWAYIMGIYKKMRPDAKFQGNPKYSRRRVEADLEDSQTLGDLRSEVAAALLEEIIPELDDQEYYDESLLARLAATDILQTSDEDDDDPLEEWQETLLDIETSDVAKDLLKLMVLMSNAQSTSNVYIRLGKVLCMLRETEGLDIFESSGETVTPKLIEYLES